ncbi:hypothetical protein Tco_0419061 [Tanacetum coccineum]
MALPPHDQRYQYLRYERLQYTYADISYFKEILGRIYSREIHRVKVVDFQSMPELMRDVLDTRMLMEHHDDGGVLGGARRRMSWRQFIVALGLHTKEEMESPGLDVGSVNIPYLLARYLRRFFARRKREDLIFRGQFIARLAEHFRLLMEERLQGLTVIMRELPVIDMAELAVPAPVQAPPPPLATARTIPRRMARLEEDVHEVGEALAEQRDVIGAMARDFSRFTVWPANGIAQLLDSARVTYTPYSETHVSYQRRVRCRTDGVSTSAAQQQPDP